MSVRIFIIEFSSHLQPYPRLSESIMYNDRRILDRVYLLVLFGILEQYIYKKEQRQIRPGSKKFIVKKLVGYTIRLNRNRIKVLSESNKNGAK